MFPRPPIRLEGPLPEAGTEVRDVHKRGLVGHATVPNDDKSRFYPVQLLIGPLQELSVGKPVRIRIGHEPDSGNRFVAPFELFPKSGFSLPGAGRIGKQCGEDLTMRANRTRAPRCGDIGQKGRLGIVRSFKGVIPKGTNHGLDMLPRFPHFHAPLP